MSSRYSVNRTNKDGLVYFNLKIDNTYNNLPYTDDYGKATAKPGAIVLKPGQILEKQSNYKLAIDFFNVSSISLPIMFCEILEGDNDNNILTQYGFCLEHTLSGTKYPSRVEYVPDATASTYDNKEPKAPLDNNGLQDYITSPYFYAVYTIAHLLNLFNIALFTSWNAMNTAFPASSPPVPPYFFYDEPSGRINLILHQTYVRTPLANIYWNSQTEKYIEGLRIELTPAYFTGGQTNFDEIKLQPSTARPYDLSAIAGAIPAAFGFPSEDQLVTAPTFLDAAFLPWRNVTNTNYYVMMQEYDCLPFWCNIKSLVFYTSALAVAPEYLPLTNNPNAIQSVRVLNMTIASPSVVTTQSAHKFSNNAYIYISRGSYSVGGVPITITTPYVAKNVTANTFQLYSITGAPVNVTAYNPAVPMWTYTKSGSNIGNFNNPTGNILAYFDILCQRGIDWRTNAYSLPAYRKYHDLIADSPLNEIDISIKIELNNGALIPYTIGINDSIDMKLCFRRNGIED